MKAYMIIISYYNSKENNLATEVFDEVYDKYNEAFWRVNQLTAEKADYYGVKANRIGNDSLSVRVDLPTGESYLYSIKDMNITISI